MSPGRITDQRVEKVDKNDDQWTTFLKGHGLTVGLKVVREVAEQVVLRQPLHPLYGSRDRIPLAGKATVYKIKRLVQDGSLEPLLCHWGLKERSEEDPIQLAHLRALKTFLQEDALLHGSFSVGLPSNTMDFLLQQLVRGNQRIIRVVRSTAWEAYPIVSRIRDHCPGHHIWKDIEEWKRKRGEYLTSIDKIGKTLLAEFRNGLLFPSSVITNSEQEQGLLSNIFSWLIGQLLGTVPRHGPIHSAPDDKEGLCDPIFRLTWGSSCYAEGMREQIECAKGVIEDMLKRWSNSDDIRSLAHQYQSLEVLGQRIRDELQGIDETVLAQGRCPDCPTLRSKQG